MTVVGFTVWDAVTELEPDLERVSGGGPGGPGAVNLHYVALPRGSRVDGRYPAQLTVFSFDKSVADPSSWGRLALLELAVPYGESEGLDTRTALHILTGQSMGDGEPTSLLVDDERIGANGSELVRQAGHTIRPILACLFRLLRSTCHRPSLSPTEGCGAVRFAAWWRAVADGTEPSAGSAAIFHCWSGRDRRTMRG